MMNKEEILNKMKDVNPDIKMDSNFKRSLKNKLEVTNYAKIKNTKNKKINKVKNKFFTFRNTGNNIFEKPKLSFFKIISPIFIGAFAVFGFYNFYGQDIFQLNDFNLKNNFYNLEKISEDEEIKEEVSNNNLPITSSKNEQVKNESKKLEIKNGKADSLSTESFHPQVEPRNHLKNSQKKSIDSFNHLKKIETKKVKIEKNKKIKAKKIIKTRELPKTGGGENNFFEKKKPIIVEKPKEKKVKIEEIKTESIKKDESVNTELLNIFGKENENIKKEEEKNYACNDGLEPACNKQTESNVYDDDSAVDLIENVTPSATVIIPKIEKSNFEKFCEDKKGILENNICKYGEKKCSKKDFFKIKCN